MNYRLLTALLHNKTAALSATRGNTMESHEINYKGEDLTVSGEYTEASYGTYDTPGLGASFYIKSVKLDDEEIMQNLSLEQLYEIEEEVLTKIEEAESWE